MKRILPFLLTAASGFAQQPNTELFTPWFTGSLLAPTPINMEVGHPALEPSITILNTYGQYNSSWKEKSQPNIWAINPLIDFLFALSENWGVEIYASTLTNFQKGKSATHFQDTIVLLGYQVSHDTRGTWIPDFRINIQETFPTGKYQKLNPNKLAIDYTGQGSFQTGPLFVCRKLFYFQKHALSLVWSVGYLFPSKVSVKGFNTYGGGYGTKGTVRPGQTLTAFFSGEYSLTQNWVFAFDTELLYQRSSHFSGKEGKTLTGEAAQVGLPPFMQISFAPQIEYNFSSSSGLEMGVWFTLAGKNSNAFGSGFISYMHIF